MNGQYAFTWDTQGNVNPDNVVATGAHESGPKEKQAGLLDHARDLEALGTWEGAAIENLMSTKQNAEPTTANERETP